MRRTYIVPLGLLLLSCMPGFAQERRWTLEECIAHAYEHNIEIKARELTAAEKRIALAESKWSYAPRPLRIEQFIPRDGARAR